VSTSSSVAVGSILVLPMRSPVEAAKSLATIDLFSGITELGGEVTG
jgi:alkanesulfonate monooxygenase SsuD/methylene tetrahydromethanopterin reductase-like flavin-dependent oxidoreductase (luciferase family)